MPDNMLQVFLRMMNLPHNIRNPDPRRVISLPDNIRVLILIIRILQVGKQKTLTL